MWDRVFFIVVTAIVTFFMVKHWNEIVYEIGSWARARDYHGVIKILCTIEDVRSGIRQLTFKFLGKKGESKHSNPPVITIRTIKYEDLPPEFRYIGTREHEMTV